MTNPPSLRAERIAQVIGVIALLLVTGALGFQYIVHLAPCEMCHWQRWPLIAAALQGLVLLPLMRAGQRKAAIIVAGAAALAGLLVAFHWNMLADWQPVLVAGVVILLTVLPLLNVKICGAVLALVAVSGLIGLYQTGMQYHILPGPQACTAALYVIGSGAPAPQVACDVPTWWFLGLALPAWNAILSLGTAALGAAGLRRA